MELQKNKWSLRKREEHWVVTSPEYAGQNPSKHGKLTTYGHVHEYFFPKWNTALIFLLLRIEGIEDKRLAEISHWYNKVGWMPQAMRDLVKEVKRLRSLANQLIQI